MKKEFLFRLNWKTKYIQLKASWLIKQILRLYLAKVITSDDFLK